MENPNALISMACVSANSNNPYKLFCEYIKYCITKNHKEELIIPEITSLVDEEFGIHLPKGILEKCLVFLERENFISKSKANSFTLLKVVGDFDIDTFEKSRKEFKRKENALVDECIKYASSFDKKWNRDYAREQLTKVLQENDFAFNVFMNTKIQEKKEEQEESKIFVDENITGRFVKDLLAEDSAARDYLIDICTGIMVCTGAYQMASKGFDTVKPYIKGTTFYFDTRLILRYIGCSGEEETNATKDLVKMIKSGGGKIACYEHTKSEVIHALDEAIKRYQKGKNQKTYEMDRYINRLSKPVESISFKKTTLSSILDKDEIYVHEAFPYDENDMKSFGFDIKSLEYFMRSKVMWGERVVENDARSIWETHMRRRGKYDDYYGTSRKLPVFVTNNSELIYLALTFKENYSVIRNIEDWRNNSLPVITESSLTCRLWQPMDDNHEVQMHILAANAVAAMKPTESYIEKMKEIAEEFKSENPQYSNVCLSEYVSDQMNDNIIRYTKGNDSDLDIASVTVSMKEVFDCERRADAKKFNEEKEKMSSELESSKLENERKDNEIKSKDKLIEAKNESTIENASNRILEKHMPSKLLLRVVINLPVLIVSTMSLIGLIVSVCLGDYKWTSQVIVPVIFGISEHISNNFVTRHLLRKCVKSVKDLHESKIIDKLYDNEQEFQLEIISRINDTDKLLIKANGIIEKSK